MINLSPKSQFLRRHDDLVLALRDTIPQPWFQEAMTYALAQMTENGATRDELNGAKLFREALATLGEPEAQPEDRPDKSTLPAFEPKYEPADEKAAK